MADDDRGPASGPVAWDVAERVARAVLGAARATAPGVLPSLELDFAEASALAESLVSDATGLTSSAGPTRSVVTDRMGWVRANLRSFERMLAPLGERLASGSARSRRALSPASRSAAGAEVGLLLAWMSSRVLGQYDMPGRDGEGDVVYYVGPNVAELERRNGFAPREFRLWIAIHEVTHRLQFTGVPWLQDHFRELVDRGLAIGAPDGRAILDALVRAGSELRAGRNPLADGGIVGLLASSEQLVTLREAQALMSLLEGHGDVVMGLAGEGAVPGAPRFAETLRRRRESATGVARVVQQLVGVETKLRQYAQGEHFVERVREVGGDELFSRVWSSPEALPTIEEIRDPDLWVGRVTEVARARA
ncbi:MAG: zinc-dependent metalloprotease [Actinomycetota bacterium]|nr:zinc-dependent metalloprotease [Actinomycetota bacterium]